MPPHCSCRAQAIGTWFGNEARAVAGLATSKSSGVGRKGISTKQWNYRTVAASLHSDRLKEIKDQLIAEYTGEGNAAMRTYATGVTTLMNQLSDEEVQQCREVAEEWNKKPPPPEVQRKCVWTLHFNDKIVLITPFEGQPSISTQ
jgi:hypothetical protein